MIAPGRRDQDFPIWCVLHEMLTGGDAARLPRRLEIQDRTVLDVSTSLYDFSLPALFELDATMKSGAQ